jgi:hypothetical protein
MISQLPVLLKYIYDSKIFPVDMIFKKEIHSNWKSKVGRKKRHFVQTLRQMFSKKKRNNGGFTKKKCRRRRKTNNNNKK